VLASSFASIWSLLEADLFSTPSPDGLFNPYHDRVEGIDHPDAVALRRANLRNYLSCYTEPPVVFLLAEAPGP